MKQRALSKPFVVVTGWLLGCGASPESAQQVPITPPPTAAPADAVEPASPVAAVEVLDSDGDSIDDREDGCPTEPETFNGRDDEDGCPDQAVVIISSNPPPVVHIRFEGATTNLVPDAQTVLDEVANVLRDHPEVELVYVEGHADTATPKELALKGSKARADAVVAALKKRGVDKARLRAIGLGAHCPLDESPSAERPKRNRRVEFKIAIRSGEPVEASTLGCQPAHDAGLVPDPIGGS